MDRTHETARAPRRIRVVALTGAFAFAGILGGCGESKEEKALKTVCSARADISTKVKELQTLTPSTQAVTQLQTAGQAISADLKKIAEAQKDLTPARKAEIEAATEQFTKAASEAFAGLSTASSPQQLLAGLSTALHKLGTAYKQALEPVKCS